MIIVPRQRLREAPRLDGCLSGLGFSRAFGSARAQTHVGEGVRFEREVLPGGDRVRRT